MTGFVVRVFTILGGLLLTALSPSQASAAEDRCIAVAQAPDMKAPDINAPHLRGPGFKLVQPARFRVAEIKAGDVRLTFAGHSTFLIESGKGVAIATDYNDYVRPPRTPDIATMNRAHSSHFTNFPDPNIPHVLKGWNPLGGPAQHDITERDVRVRNIPTNIRGSTTGTDEFGNSIFIFEMGTLCIAHLGHLHHTLSDRQIAQIGQMDVILAPVDGSYTLDTQGMVEVLKSLKAPLVIPMHYFSSFTLSRFLDVARPDYEVKIATEPTVVLSRATLPSKPQILVLPGG